MTRSWMTSVGVVGVALATVAPAHAGVYVTLKGETAQTVRVRALVGHYDGMTTLLQSAEVQSRATRFVWLKPFPVTPDVAVEKEITFTDLDQQTTVGRPMNHSVRDDLFGPSVASIVVDRLRPRADAPLETAAPEPPRTLQFLGYHVFRGDVQTSTISGRMVVPSDMRAWFNRRGYPLSEAAKASMAGHLNRGWTIIAIELADRASNLGAFANTPMVSFRFPSEQALMPMMRQPEPLESEPIFDVWTLGASRLVPQNYATAWSSEPWAHEPVPGRFTALYSSQVTATEPLVAILRQQLGLQLPPTPQLVRHRFQHGGEVWQEQAFVPAVQPIDIPSGSTRGGALDIFLCVLLGLLPLVFAPESWLLLWLGGRSRAREREGGASWPNLWAYYAMGVALYWIVTLDGLARLAAVLPLLIGITQLAWPGPPSRNEFVRVQFKKKAKASS